MRNNCFFPGDLDGGSPSIFPMQPFVPTHLLSHISSFVDNSLYNFTPGGLALREALNCISKFAGSLLLWFASGSNSNINRKLTRNSCISNQRSCKSSTRVNHITSITHNLTKSSIPGIFGKISSFAVRQLCDEAHRFQSLPFLSLAAALVPPFDSVSRNILAVPMEGNDVINQRYMVQSPCDRGCADLSFPNLDCMRHAVEPRTGIEFPTILDNILAGETNSSFLSEVLVGTGSRTMKIIKIKSLKVYAFGFYVHPYDVCEKLGPKYASISASEVNRHSTFYEDLLREDISMTVRLVVSCNGVKIKTVKDAFEKSLRARLVKTNPHTDYDCLKTFGSLFSQDIPIRAGTTIYFRRTADGHLVTEIGGNQIGAVHSKDLCRAFFDMYIGDVPVCEQTKEEIGKNVASIIRRC